nr:helveticin J family class III bacteriocin [Lactobacillus helveticus]
MNSVQGYDLDNQGDIYISSQKSPDLEKKILS